MLLPIERLNYCSPDCCLVPKINQQENKLICYISCNTHNNNKAEQQQQQNGKMLLLLAKLA